MTGRGMRPPVPLPLPDPTLESHPVPRERHFPVRSVGPGAAPDARHNLYSAEELNEHANRVGLKPLEETDIRQLLKFLTSEHDMDWREDGSYDETFDPTWGPTIVVTAYSENARRNLDQALSNLVEVVHVFLFQDSRFDPFARETFSRLRFDVIEEKGLLEHASDDRVREEFNAYVRSLRLFPEDLRHERLAEKNRQRLGLGCLNRPHSPGRFGFCIVLDEKAIEDLATITFPDGPQENAKVLNTVSLKVIERYWDYPETVNPRLTCGSGPEKRYYDGTDISPVFDLPMICGAWYDHDGLNEMFFIM
ncbi:hypothetical protein FSPOR_11503 [Fusarium sporotrichioides]|uniref:Uncharacterized protein n=1 Tax=Fusarium sporotrichioides TaxID=5514 RepID=A0A395RGF8_FUSSP|nr:hypothetical protein FSPOR_11503 [Fusarium sporotrichioides]